MIEGHQHGIQVILFVTGFFVVSISIQNSASVVLAVTTDHRSEREDSEEESGKEEGRQGNVFGDANMREVDGLALGVDGCDSLPT